MSRIRAVFALLTNVGFFTGTSARAATIAPPKDLGQLLHMSDAVVYAEAMESWTEPSDGVPISVTRFQVHRLLAGIIPGMEFQVQEVGGQWKDRAAIVPGSPAYLTGSRYVLFLDRGPGLRWRSRMMAYGLLVEDEANGLLRPLPEADELAVAGTRDFEPPGVYHREALLGHLQEVAAGSRWDPRRAQEIRAVWGETHNAPSACAFLLYVGDSLPFRYFGFDLGGMLSIIPTTPVQTGYSSAAAVAAAVGAWTNDAGSVINYTAAASQATTFSCAGDNSAVVIGEAIFNDPCNEIGNLVSCAGVLAFGGSSFSLSTIAYHGEQWHNGAGAFTVVNNGLSACFTDTAFRETLTHELGHSLGFGHHTDGDATMFGTLHNDGRGASLRATDQACADYVYHVGDPVRRQELASLLLRAQFGGTYNPPGCNPSPYSDVVCASTPFAAFIKDLDTRNISQGCGGGGTLFCPGDIVTREQAAMLLLKTLGIAQDPCGGTTGYGDVSCADPYGPWVKELRDQGITAGCNGGNTLFCPKDALTRSELSLWFVEAGLTIPPAAP